MKHMLIAPIYWCVSVGNYIHNYIIYFTVNTFVYTFPSYLSFNLFFFLHCIFFFLKFYFTFKHYNIVLVLPNIEMNLPQVYMWSLSWTLLPPLSPYHPSGSSQCSSPKHPVSWIEPGLATHFIHDIIHVSMPFSQIFLPSPSPTEFIRLFYTSVSLLLSRIQGYCYHLYNSIICVSILYWCFPFWLTSLCIIGSSFIHLIRTDSNEFFLMAE